MVVTWSETYESVAMILLLVPGTGEKRCLGFSTNIGHKNYSSGLCLFQEKTEKNTGTNSKQQANDNNDSKHNHMSDDNNNKHDHINSAVFWGITWCRVVNNYHMTLRNTPEDRRFHQHRCGSLKSRLITTQMQYQKEGYLKL